MKKRLSRILFSFGILSLISGTANAGPMKAALGLRAGLSRNPDQFVVGAHAEVGSLGLATIVPSVDLGFGDNSNLTAANVDLRWYLFPLPQTGIQFYAAAGPTAVFVNSQSDIGLSLIAGAKIPMKGTGRYNLEARFGVGDIPDLKVMLGVLFGL